MISNILDKQYRRPAGLLGWFIGRRMAKDHHPENLWTVSLLNAQPNDHILEIGFGSGVAIETLSSIVTSGQIYGVDFSKTMVRSAHRRNAKAVEAGRVQLHHTTVTHLPFNDNIFDKVFSIHSIYFWKDPIVALQSIYRVLKPNGTLILTILPKNKWNADDPDKAVGTPECIPYNGEELTQMLHEVGFSKTEIKSYTNPAFPSNYSVIGIK